MFNLYIVPQSKNCMIHAGTTVYVVLSSLVIKYYVQGIPAIPISIKSCLQINNLWVTQTFHKYKKFFI